MSWRSREPSLPKIETAPRSHLVQVPSIEMGKQEDALEVLGPSLEEAG